MHTKVKELKAFVKKCNKRNEDIEKRRLAKFPLIVYTRTPLLEEDSE